MEVQTNEIERVLITEEQIAARIQEVAAELDEHYKGKEPIAIGVLKGSVGFFVDLLRAMKTPVSMEFMKVSSYGSGTTSSGSLSVTLDILSDIEGKDLLVVEDIIDSGNTMSVLMKMLEQRKPASIRMVTLLDKPSRRTADITPDFTCFEIEDEFVIGYGLDYAERYRDLPYVGILSRSVYED